MGTRSLTHIHDDHTEAVLATVYRQMDGYPSGMGADLAEILTGRRMVNGFGLGDTNEVASNGAGCLAATIIMKLKEAAGIGGIYLEPPGSEDYGEEYIYSISPTLEGIRLRVESVHGGYGDKPRRRDTLFEGSINEFDPAAAEARAGEISREIYGS